MLATPCDFGLLLRRVKRARRYRATECQMRPKFEFLRIGQIALIQRIVKIVDQRISFPEVNIKKVGLSEAANL